SSRSDAAALEVWGGGVETGAVLAAAVAVEAGGDGDETGAVLAAAAAVAVGAGGAETGALFVAAAGLDAVTSALGGSARDSSMLKPTPRARAKRIVATVPNGVSTASIKVLTQFIFLFTMPKVRSPRPPSSIISE